MSNSPQIPTDTDEKSDNSSEKDDKKEGDKTPGFIIQGAEVEVNGQEDKNIEPLDIKQEDNSDLKKGSDDSPRQDDKQDSPKYPKPPKSTEKKHQVTFTITIANAYMSGK